MSNNAACLHYHLPAALRNEFSESLYVMVSQKVVTPVKTGVQSFDNYPKSLDSGIRRNDRMRRFFTFCEFIICIAGMKWRFF
jgi:hypothetical protein